MAELIWTLDRCTTQIAGPAGDNPDSRAEDEAIVTHNYPTYSLVTLANEKHVLLQTTTGMSIARRSDMLGRKKDVGWSDDFAVRFATNWLTEDLPKHLAEGTRGAARPFQWPAYEAEFMDVLSDSDMEIVRTAAASILSIAVAELADYAASWSRAWPSRRLVNLASSSCRGQLVTLASRLPEPGTWEIQYEKLKAEYQKIFEYALYERWSLQSPIILKSAGDFYVPETPESKQLEAVNLISEENRILLLRAGEVDRARDKHCPYSPDTAVENVERTIAEQREISALALRQLALRDDKDSLAKWSLESSLGSGWAYHRLRKLDSAIANDVLETVISRHRRADYDLECLMRELGEVDPARAARIVQDLPEGEHKSRILTDECRFGQTFPPRKRACRELLAIRAGRGTNP